LSSPKARTKRTDSPHYESLSQQSLFNVINAMVRSGAPAREAVLNYYARVIQLNLKRGGMQVDPETVASDAYMINLEATLLRFAEPFMDAKYSKVSLGHGSPVDLPTLMQSENRSTRLIPCTPQRRTDLTSARKLGSRRMLTRPRSSVMRPPAPVVSLTCPCFDSLHIHHCKLTTMPTSTQMRSRGILTRLRLTKVGGG
jgi:hypothetical protein